MYIYIYIYIIHKAHLRNSILRSLSLFTDGLFYYKVFQQYILSPY